MTNPRFLHPADKPGRGAPREAQDACEAEEEVLSFIDIFPRVEELLLYAFILF